VARQQLGRFAAEAEDPLEPEDEPEPNEPEEPVPEEPVPEEPLIPAVEPEAPDEPEPEEPLIPADEPVPLPLEPLLPLEPDEPVPLEEPPVAEPVVLPVLPEFEAVFSWTWPLAFRQCVAAETLPLDELLAPGELLPLEDCAEAPNVPRATTADAISSDFVIFIG
jgi:hypothetical protein